MRKLIVILFGINLLVGCKDKSPIPEKNTTTKVVYCELRGANIPHLKGLFVSPFDDKFVIGVHYGGETYNGSSIIGRTNDSQKTYGGDKFYYADTDNMTTALNIMSKEGWEFVQAYTSPHNIGTQYTEGYVCHYILKKSVVTNENK